MSNTHRDFPGDYQAQTSQGAITVHSAEHLRTSHRGVALLRKFQRAQLKLVASGADPACIARSESEATLRFADCGNFIAP
jgi:hypothetical protein